MEKKKPLLVKYGLIFGGKLSLTDYAKADHLIKNASFNFVLNLNKENNFLNYKNLIYNYTYKQEPPVLNLNFNTFLMCNLEDNDISKKHELLEYKFKYTPNLCILTGDRFDSYILENIHFFQRNGVQYIIANQNYNIKDLQYIVLKISFYSNAVEFECWHNYGWLLDYYRKNE